MRERLAKEDVTLDEQITKISTERDELAERYEMLQRSMGQVSGAGRWVAGSGCRPAGRW